MSNPEDIAGIINKATEEAIRERGRVNILIAGSTGVGKSTLINAIFQGNFAETGQGKPVTKETREYTKENIPLTIFDTRGLEKADYKKTFDELKNFVKRCKKEADHKRHIHVAWLCILEDGRRVEQAEIELHEMLADYMPVIGVITKSRSDNGFRAEVQRLLPETKNIVSVRALPEELDEGHQLPVKGLQELVDLTIGTLPEAFRRAFVASQKVSVQKKIDLAHKVVVSSASAAAVTGAVPIPFSDAVFLAPIQIGMLAGISATFGLEISTAFLGTLVASAAGATGATFTGRAIVANLLKLIPGAGTFAGGAIASTTAATLTTALGELYIATLVVLFTDSGGEVPPSEDVTREFKARLSRKTSP